MQHHHPEGVVYRSFCINSGTVAVSEVTSRWWWWCIESLFASPSRPPRAASPGGGSVVYCCIFSFSLAQFAACCVLVVFVQSMFMYCRFVAERLDRSSWWKIGLKIQILGQLTGAGGYWSGGESPIFEEVAPLPPVFRPIFDPFSGAEERLTQMTARALWHAALTSATIANNVKQYNIALRISITIISSSSSSIIISYIMIITI